MHQGCSSNKVVNDKTMIYDEGKADHDMLVKMIFRIFVYLEINNVKEKM